jgi:hypothetical protein
MTAPVYQAGYDQMAPDSDARRRPDDARGNSLPIRPTLPWEAVFSHLAPSCPRTWPLPPPAAAQRRPMMRALRRSQRRACSQGQPVNHLWPPAARPAGRWIEIQAMFVDDPRACVELAVGLVDDRVEAHVTSVRERQHWLL